MYDFPGLLGRTVSFSVYPVGILQQDFKNVAVRGILASDTARQYIDPATMHVSVYPSLPVGTPNNHQSYLYLLIQFPNGEQTCLGTPWIDPNTVMVDAEKANYAINFFDLTVADTERVRQLLLANNITRFEIRQV